MSTRSLIGIENQNKKINFIYCHNDGYIEYVGAVLHKYYNDKNLVDKLISKGDRSSLYDDLAKDGKTLYNEPYSVACDIKDYISINWGDEYKYLFKDNKWYVLDRYKAPDKPSENDFKLLIEELI